MHTSKFCSVLFSVIVDACMIHWCVAVSAVNGRPSLVLQITPRLKLLITLYQSSIQNPEICQESQFLPTPPAFDASVRGSRSEYCQNVWYEKLEWCGYPTLRKFPRYIYSLRQNTQTWRTPGQTNRWMDRHRPTA